jgi:hypothetical protein
MQTFLVECYWPRLIEKEARDILERVVGLGAEASPEQPLQSLGCILVPSDGMALFLVSAPSEAIVRRIGALTEVPFDRIVESIHIGFGCQTQRFES